MATLEDRVTALEALVGTEARVQAGIQLGLSDVTREMTALWHSAEALRVKQELTLEKVSRIDAWRETVDERLASIESALTTIAEAMRGRTS